MNDLERKRAELMATDDPGNLVDFIEKAVIAGESAKAAHHRLDTINGSIGRGAEATEGLRQGLDLARHEFSGQISSVRQEFSAQIADVKLEVSKVGIKVGIIAAIASVIGSGVVATAVGAVVYFLTH